MVQPVQGSRVTHDDGSVFQYEKGQGWVQVRAAKPQAGLRGPQSTVAPAPLRGPVTALPSGPAPGMAPNLLAMMKPPSIGGAINEALDGPMGPMQGMMNRALGLPRHVPSSHPIAWLHQPWDDMKAFAADQEAQYRQKMDSGLREDHSLGGIAERGWRDLVNPIYDAVPGFVDQAMQPHVDTVEDLLTGNQVGLMQDFSHAQGNVNRAELGLAQGALSPVMGAVHMGVAPLTRRLNYELGKNHRVVPAFDFDLQSPQGPRITMRKDLTTGEAERSTDDLAGMVGSVLSLPLGNDATVLGTFGKLGRLAAPMQDAADFSTLRQAGMLARPSQAAGGLAKTLIEAGSKQPFVDTEQIQAHRGLLGAFNKGQINAALGPVGAVLPEGIAPGQASLAAARDMAADARVRAVAGDPSVGLNDVDTLDKELSVIDQAAQIANDGDGLYAPADYTSAANKVRGATGFAAGATRNEKLASAGLKLLPTKVPAIADGGKNVADVVSTFLGGLGGAAISQDPGTRFALGALAKIQGGRLALGKLTAQAYKWQNIERANQALEAMQAARNAGTVSPYWKVGAGIGTASLASGGRNLFYQQTQIPDAGAYSKTVNLSLPAMAGGAIVKPVGSSVAAKVPRKGQLRSTPIY